MNRRPRRGYTMLFVLVFIALMLTFSSVSYRHLASSMRIEKACAQTDARDEGSLHALARGLNLLETGLPPSDPYVCAVVIGTSSGPRSYTLTFQSLGADWSLQARPTLETETPPPIPDTFAAGS